MPDRKTRKLTPDELRALGIDVPEENTTISTALEPVSKNRKSRGALGWGAGLVARLGSGLLSTEGGPLGAAISGGGEYLAQKLESGDPVDYPAVGVEAGLGAIPFSKIIKGVKPGLSVGKQVLANAGRLAGFNEVGNMVRRYNKEGHILPQSPSEWMWDLGTMAAGGAVGGYAGKVKAGKVAEEIPKSVTPPPVDKIDALVNDMARPVPNPSVPERLTRPGHAASGLGGLRIKPDTPPVKSITRSIGELGGPEIAGNAVRVEDAAPLSGGASLERGIAARKASSIHPEKIDSDGVVRQPDAVEQVLDEEIKKAAEIAKVQRKEHLRAQKAEEKLKRAEQTADTQNTKIERGGTDLRQIEAKAAAQKAKDTLKDATQEARNLNTRDKFVAKTEDVAAKQVKIDEAQKKIKEMLAAGTAEPGPRILTETTEKVPTASGNQTLRQTVVEKLKKEGDPDLASHTPAPKPDALTGKVDIPVTDPNIVAKTKYSTQDAAVNALAGSGKVGSIQRLGRGKYRVIYEDTVKAVETAPETLPVASANSGKAEAPLVPVEAPVEAAKALPEAAVKPVPEAPSEPVPTTPPVTPKTEAKMTSAELDAAVDAEIQKWDKKELDYALRTVKEPRFLAAVKKELGIRVAAGSEGKPVERIPPPPPSPTAPVIPVKAKGPKTPKTPTVQVAPAKPTLPVVATSQNPEGVDPTRLTAVGDQVVDLTNAKDSGEVSNRVLNELLKYKKVVDEAEAAVGINEKGERVGGKATVKPVTIHVPGGPTYTIGPDQVDNAIERFEKGLTNKGYKQGGTPQKITPADAFQGIVDTVKRPTETRISTGYGGGQVKIPIAPIKPVAKAVGKITTKEGSATPTAPLAPGEARSVESLSQPAVKQSVNDLAILRKEAADKYFALKEAHAAGTASKEDLRAAGKAYGEADHALATAAKSEGKEADFSSTKPEVPAKPVKVSKADKAAGPTSDELTQMAPEEQEKALTDIVSKFKKLRSKSGSESGATNVALLTKLGMSGAGAIAGAASNPDDPITGALIGAGAGFYAPAAFSAVMKHLNSKTLPPEVEASSRQKVGQWVWDKGQTALQMMPDYYRASDLSNIPSTIMNMWAGPYGSAVMYSIENALAGDPRGAKALKELMAPMKLRFIREYFKSWDEAQAKLSDAAERGGGEIGKHGPLWFRKVTSFPAHLLTAGDVAARRILMESGFSELEARGGNLTSEPISGLMQGLGNMLKTKGPHGHPSWVGRMLLPFYRTNANQLEQGIIRIPVIGHGFRKYWKMTPIDKRLEIVQGAMSLGTGGVSYALGAIIPQNKQKSALKFLSNFGGVYGTTMALAFVAGAASQNDSSAAKQLSAMSTRFLGQDMPLPSLDLATQSVNALKAMIDDDPDTSPKLPYGVVPPFLSSKQVVSLPTLLRGENPLSYDATVTKDEHFLAVPPFTRNVELKKEPKTKTSSERAVEKQKEMYAKYRKQIKDKAKQ